MLKGHQIVSIGSETRLFDKAKAAKPRGEVTVIQRKIVRKGYLTKEEETLVEKHQNTVVHYSRHMIGQFLMTGLNNLSVRDTNSMDMAAMLSQASGSYSPGDDATNTGLRLFMIGCGAVSGVSSLGGTIRPPAEYDATDPYSAALYVPLAFITESNYNALTTDEKQKYRDLQTLASLGCYYKKIATSIQTYQESGLVIPLALQVTLDVDYSEANYNQQDWDRSELSSWQNDNQLTYINELALYFANVNDLDDSSQWWVYAHVTMASYPKDADTAYTFIWTLYF